jgi:hypothetical protein
MAFNIVASDESACPPAGAAHKPAQLDIIDHTESQRLIPAKFFVKGGSDQVKCADTQPIPRCPFGLS